MTPRYHDRPARVAVFPGSFNPYTVGHADIVRRGLELFDHIIICVGVNIAKAADSDDATRRVDAIRAAYAHQPRVSVERWSGLTAVFARDHGACALLRGVRSVRDYEYERDLADANNKLTGVETVILYADPQYSWISSSTVRELMAHDPDMARRLVYGGG